MDSSNSSVTAKPSIPSDSQLSSVCISCNKPLDGQFVRALGGVYHLDCFKCLDCDKVVAAKFFPLQAEGGKSYPLCERDYFRRLNLLCAKCGEALRGSYITAVNKKYHLDHFTCSLCDTVFGPDETYYEHDANIYCNYHYSIKHAVMCGGCKMPILKQFVEVKNGDPSAAAAGSGSVVTRQAGSDSDRNEQWHPECYMIYKSWNIKLASSSDLPLNDLSLKLSKDDVKRLQTLMEEKSTKIWTVLSAFEESAAACISDMLLHVSNQGYIDAVHEAGNFICHVDVLFAGIDHLDAEMAIHNDNIGISYNKEPKLLSKKIVNFFSLLSHTQDTGVRQYGTVTQELLSLVTGLAQYLKILIRVALAGALKLERKYGSKTSIGDFLNKLVELGQREMDADVQALKFDQKFKLTDLDVKSDLCVKCRTSVEDACIRFHTMHWHTKCFYCSKCQKSLLNELKDAFFDPVENQVLCSEHKVPGSRNGFEKVTQLQQYTFLLRVALKRLYGLLKVKDDSSSVSYSKLTMPNLTATSTEAVGIGIGSDYELSTSPSTIESTSLDVPARGTTQDSNDGSKENKTKSNAADDLSVPTTKLIDSAPKFGSVHNIIEDAQHPGRASSKALNIPDRQKSIRSKNDPGSTSKLSCSLPELQAGPVAKAKKETDSNWGLQDSKTELKRFGTTSSGRKLYLADMSALESFMVRHMSIVKLQPYVQEYFSMTELVDLIKNRKATFWSKIMSTLKPVKKPVKVDGVFGVPLEQVIERCGVDSKHGRGRVRIPALVDSAISSLKKQSLKVEGIFRKNGNIKNLNTLQESADRNMGNIDLSKENVIQIAALLKKFLRDMPEPLLTFKLYKIFIAALKTPNADHRRKILHYACCLLPQPNRDLLEVLLDFLKFVASFSGGEDGNKMDISNLATVIAPNILYSKSKDKVGTLSSGNLIKDESFLAIEVVKSLLNFQDDLWTVPPEIAEVLPEADNNVELANKDSKDVIKYYEILLSNKKSHNSRDVHVGESSQYPTGTAATIESSVSSSASTTDRKK